MARERENQKKLVSSSLHSLPARVTASSLQLLAPLSSEHLLITITIAIKPIVMACLPRFMIYKQKSCFTLAKDQNIDTVLHDANDKSVKIGRYIRREETPLFAINYTERLKQQQSQQQRDQQKQPHLTKKKSYIINYKHLNGNNNNKRNSNSSYSSNRISNSINNTDTVNSLINQETSSTTREYNNKYKNYLNNINQNSKKYQQLKANGNILYLNEDDSIKIEASHKECRLMTVSTREDLTQIDQNKCRPRFFIGNGKDDHEEYDDEYSQTKLPSNTHNYKIKYNENITKSLPNIASTREHSIKYSHCHPRCNKFCSIDDCNRLKKFLQCSGISTSTSVTTTTSTSTTAPTANTTVVQHNFASSCTEVIHIPPPPPMPPQPLIHVKSYIGLSNSNAIKEKRQMANVKQNIRNTIRSISYDPTLISMEEFFDITAVSTQSTHSHTDVSASTNCSNYSNRNNNNNNSNNNLFYNTNSPKSQRLEGGLIFTRSNVPIKKAVHVEFIEKDEITRNLIRTAIEKNEFLNNYMDRERKEMVIDAMELKHFHKDSFIINENDEGSEIYVSEEGQFDVIQQGRIIGSFGGATVFGELAILYNAKRFASIRAATNATVWKIDRDKFRKIMVISRSKEREENLNFLRSAPFLKDLSEDVLHKVVDLLQRKFFTSDACIVREGDIGNEFFIIRGGTVTIKKRSVNGGERIVDRRRRGDYFGEQALLNADCRQASVYADPPGTEVLQLHREAFISYLGTIPQLRQLPIEKLEHDCRNTQNKSEFDNEYADIELLDLRKIATLGAGAFGKVDLVTCGEMAFALKVIKKIDVVKQDQIEHVYNEKHVMVKCRGSPFIIELYKTFRDDKFVYFLMEACMGGDVWTIMSQRKFFDEKTARFIAACVTEAFDFLHSHNIIYRDLKPENLMLTNDGYCKLVDFGFAKELPSNQKTHTFAGTPEYVAPEIILDRGHDRSADYWALGILIFELLVGKTPFRGQNQIKIYQQILGGIDVVQMPSKIPKTAQSLIKALCKQLPAERLGYQRRGIFDIKNHSWFDSLEWFKLKSKQLISPIKRHLTSKTDIRYFGNSNFMGPDKDPPAETSGWDVNF